MNLFNYSFTYFIKIVVNLLIYFHLLVSPFVYLLVNRIAGIPCQLLQSVGQDRATAAGQSHILSTGREFSLD